jgi:Uma2 family endonuclease
VHNNRNMAGLPIPRVSEEEYLRIERAAQTKSEFVYGEIFAMSGGSAAHNSLGPLWIAALVNRLKGRGCRVFSSDMRVRTRGSGSNVYPDLSVACGKPQFHGTADDVLVNPVLVVEVLSPSTANYDRSVKFDLYREIESLQDYVLVHTDGIHVEQYTRQPGLWHYREHRGAESVITIASIGCEIPLGEVYGNVLDELAG